MNIYAICRTQYELGNKHIRNPVFKRLEHTNTLLLFKNKYNIYDISLRGKPDGEKVIYIVKRNKAFLLCSYVRPPNKRLSVCF